MSALKWLLIAGVGALALEASPALALLDTVTARVPFPPALVFQKFETTYRLEHVWLSSLDGLTIPGTSPQPGHTRAANDSAPTYFVAAATVGR